MMMPALFKHKGNLKHRKKYVKDFFTSLEKDRKLEKKLEEKN